MHRAFRLAFASVPLFATAVPVARLQAQNSTGSIVGAVRDPSAAVVTGMRVTARNEETGLVRASETNAEGLYRLPFLPAES
ncbi:MAG: carboxypeptidase regulatory-like domain-containing protein [Acidobacteria bacterium]|nr:carboxypeptidase regulatory-like domain-containing protein [Acidobacteriota bacterium]